MEEEDGIIDDCTAIVAFLDVSAPSHQNRNLKALSKKSLLQVGAENSVSRTLSQVAKRASYLLTPQEIIQKVTIGTAKK